MFNSRFLSLCVLASLLSGALTDPNSVCLSFGVDFEDEGHYFINKDSNEEFTCVSKFRGCNEGDDKADILLIDPDNMEYLCDSIDTTPADDPKLSTCPILKNQMWSGHWIILILGNNMDGFPFAWQRDIHLDVGPQATETETPTMTYTITTTPTSTITSTTTETFISTTGPLSTVTIPSATARRTKKITPRPVTTTATKSFTRTRLDWTKELEVTTKTKTATCTVPSGPGRPDKPCTYTPTKLRVAALETPTGAPPKLHRYVRKTDRAIDYEYARSRFEAAKLRRDLNARAAAGQLEERAPDAPTITETAPTPVNTTLTETAPVVTITEPTVTTTTSTSTLPPVTVFKGVYTATVTLPTPTRTRYDIVKTTTTKTITIKATFTRTTTVTPSASVTPCRRRGGHIGNGRF